MVASNESLVKIGVKKKQKNVSAFYAICVCVYVLFKVNRLLRRFSTIVSPSSSTASAISPRLTAKQFGQTFRLPHSPKNFSEKNQDDAKDENEI